MSLNLYFLLLPFKAKMESLGHYCNLSHGISLLGVLNEQRLKGQLCDVVLLVGDQQYQAHKSVLAACSEYFQSVFSRRDAENHSIVQLDFCEPDAFEIVLNYIYSSSLFVEKCSLAAIQELGYSLGIPFLTNIMSVRPQASYSVSRKRMSLSEEEDGASQKRSVIVHQGQGEQPGMDVFQRKSSTLQGKPFKQATEPPSLTHDFSNQSHSSGHVRPNEKESNSTSKSRSSDKNTDDGDCRSIISSPTSILRRRTEYRSQSMRPQLTSSVSFSESVQHASLQSDQTDGAIDGRMEASHDSRPVGEHQGPRNQTVDRSGPLIKSLLRRSLSMDSPVPVFSPALELKDSQSREQSVVKLITTTARSPFPENEDRVSKDMPLLLRSRQRNAYQTEGTQTTQLRIKAEPSSPLADPSEIVRITVGDNLPVNFKDFQANYDEGPRGYFTPSMKRKTKIDGSYMPFKRSRPVNEHHLMHQESTFDEAPYNSNTDNSNEEPGELRPNKMFKCWNCLKVFRSNAGLYRHVNMYHNPEKPYACDICHKRFHTNFKVWTHCQTQHGVVQNPAPSSSSYTVVKKDHEAHCKYKKLTCLECMRTFKSSFSIWRHQVEVHNHNMMSVKEQLTLGLQESNHDESSNILGVPPSSQELIRDSREEGVYSDSSVPPMYDSEDSSSYVPEDLSAHGQGELQVKEEPQEEAVSAKDGMSTASVGSEEPGVWPCEKCGKLFSAHKDLERHQELLCHIKPFICHICHKAFRTNFRLWSHYQSHMSTTEEPEMRDIDRLQSSPSPSPPLTISIPEPPTSPLKATHSGVDAPGEEPRGSMSPSTKPKKPEQDKTGDDEPREQSHTKSDSTEKTNTPEESDTLFYHAPTLSALTFKRQYMCKFCHRTFKTAFSLWSHEQSHT
uniref:Zinc finger and BTB domain containing 21 n=1 Tax=Cyprinus carpio TaxID=7962 RepID=A0A8C2JBD4_CYPCA